MMTRLRRRLAQLLDPNAYIVAAEMYGCLSGLTEELYEHRYEGKGSPGSCCYQSVYDYEGLRC